MSKANQAELAARLKQADTPDQIIDIALELLDTSRSRQHVDAALGALSQDAVKYMLGDRHRSILRAKAQYYFQYPDKDKAGMIREAIIRLLVEIGNPEDVDLYMQGVMFYEHQPVLDVAQNLRAASLAGIAAHDSNLACIHATKLLGEEDTSHFNCEPAMTAIDVLLSNNHILPVYQFLLLRGRDFIPAAKGDVVGKALESLGADFPLALFTELAESYLELDVAVVSAGIVNHIVTHRIESLYPMLEKLIEDTSSGDLHRYALITLAASRDETLWNMLYRLAQDTTVFRAPNFIEAVDLTSDDEKHAILAMLQRRKKGK